ncbi:hypothetical protein [Magnetofaba australis]|uniref:hypothetical protein n=1 Tax=Magnetofaba australis TaxID=1472297 RepID=UPI0011802F5C|nr:hypothetical protein [Magnetofaba australis]
MRRNRRNRFDSSLNKRRFGGGPRRSWPKWLLLLVLLAGGAALALKSCDSRKVEPTTRYERLPTPPPTQ